MQVKINELILALPHGKEDKNYAGLKFAVNNGDILTNPLANVVVPKYDENHGEAITLEEKNYSKKPVAFLSKNSDNLVL